MKILYLCTIAIDPVRGDLKKVIKFLVVIGIRWREKDKRREETANDCIFTDFMFLSINFVLYSLIGTKYIKKNEVDCKQYTGSQCISDKVWCKNHRPTFGNELLCSPESHSRTW